MDVVKLLRLLYRRKLVVLPMLFLAALSLAAAYKLPPPTYLAKGSMLLLNPPAPPPAVPVEPGGTTTTTVNSNNPYLRVDNSAVILDAIARILHSAPVAQDLKAKGVKGVYAVNANLTDGQGPIIDFSDQAQTAAGAVHSAQLVMDEAGRQLAAIQAEQGTDPKYFIKAQAVVAPTRATRVFSSALRRLFAVGFLDALAVVVVALIAEAASTRRAAPRDAEDEQRAERPLVLQPEEAPPAPTLEPAVVHAIRSNGHDVARLHSDGPLRLTKPVRQTTGKGQSGIRTGRAN
jgi:hypothetical protein